MAEKPKYLFGEMYIVSADAELKVFNHMTGILKEIENNKDDILVSKLIKYVDNYKTRLKDYIKMDISLTTPEERVEKVKEIIANSP